MINEIERVELLWSLNVIRHSFVRWTYDKTKPFLKCVKEVLPNKKNVDKNFCRQILFESEVQLIKEIFIIARDYVKGDFSPSLFDQEFAELKQKCLIADPNKISDALFIINVRNAFCHNNELSDTPEAKFIYRNTAPRFQINLKDGTIIEIPADELFELVLKILNNTTPELRTRTKLIYRQNRIENAVINGYFDPEKHSRYFTYVDPLDTTEIDEHQKRALLNYFKDPNLYTGIGPVSKCCFDAFSKFFPFKNSKLTILDSRLAICYTIHLLTQKLNITCEEFHDDLINLVGEEYFGRTLCLTSNHQYVNYFLTCNILLNILTNRKLEDIEPLPNVSEEQLKTLRNSLTHGFYFYDYGIDLVTYVNKTKKQVLTYMGSYNLSDIDDYINNVVRQRRIDTVLGLKQNESEP